MDTANNLRRDIEEALQRGNLNDWQRKFLADIHARLERSGGSATLSDKQWKKIFEVLGQRSKVVKLQPREPLYSRPVRRRRYDWPSGAMGRLRAAKMA
jgi:hypothetical protein